MTRTMVSGGHSFTMLAGAGNHSCGLDEEGTVWCWGRNHRGQFANGTNDDSNEPAAAAALQLLAISAGFDHTCGLDLEGYVHSWGNDSEGQLGNGSFEDCNLPTLVSDTTQFIAITAGSALTCALESSSGGNA